jgi:hypothetical protein
MKTVPDSKGAEIALLAQHTSRGWLVKYYPDFTYVFASQLSGTNLTLLAD